MAIMTEEWVSFWYQCLSMNMDYSAYCTARDIGNLKKCHELESKFDKVASIYEDFGTLDGWPESGINSDLWREWYEPRQHLFISAPRLVNAVNSYTPRAGYLLFEVPVTEDKASIASTVAKLITDQRLAGNVALAPQPKYALQEKKGRPAHGYKKVRDACISTARSYRYDPNTYEELRHVDAIAAFIRHEIDNLGWTLDPIARRDLERSGTLSEQRLESFKTRLNRSRSHFKAFAANTIRASFPDDRPFESDVLDIF